MPALAIGFEDELCQLYRSIADNLLRNQTFVRKTELPFLVIANPQIEHEPNASLGVYFYPSEFFFLNFSPLGLKLISSARDFIRYQGHHSH